VTLSGLYYGYRQLRKVQSQRMTSMALSYLQENKVKEARMSLQTALRLAPSNPAALRLQARLMEVQGESSESLSAYSQLARSGKMSLADLRPYASTAERQGDPALADRLAEAASKNNPLLGHLVRADLLVLRKQPDLAAGQLRAAIQEDAGDKNHAGDMARRDLVQLLMTRMGASSPDQLAKNRAEVLDLLRELGGRETLAGPESLAMALQSGVVPPAERDDWIKKLRMHPKVTPELLLFADAASIQADPAQKGAVVAAMIARVKPAPLGERLAAIRLLMELNDPADASQMITPDEALKNVQAFTLWMQVMRITGRDAELLAALSLPSNPLPPHLRDLFRAEELKRSGESAKGEEVFQKAYEDHVVHGTGDPERLQTLIILSADGKQELFEKGFVMLLAEPAKAQATLNAVKMGIRSQRDSAKLLRVLELASASPSLAGSLALENDLDHARLLMNQQVDLDRLKTRVEANPNEFAFRVTEALALMKSGESAKALEVMENIEAKVEASKLPPDQMAVLAMAMAAYGSPKQAASLLSAGRRDLLSVQETSLLKEAFAAANGEQGVVKDAAPAVPKNSPPSGTPSTTKRPNSHR
jgi:Tfp pilus assembly protein PilF